MKKAYLMIRNIARFLRFKKGLKAAGYEVHDRIDCAYGDGDVLVLWNRYGDVNTELAASFERFGGRVLVAENGYVTPDASGRRYTAIAVGGHNGSGTFPEGDGARWARMEIELKPWRNGGDWIILCAQRGLGAPGMAMPDTFMNETEKMLRDLTDMHVERRDPPSRSLGQPPLEELFERTHAVVVWTSNVATKALIEGVPAFFLGPHHIMEGAAIRSLVHILKPPRPKRLPAFERMARAQWTSGEIESGEAFKCLLD